MELKDATMFCSKWLPSWTGGAEAVENLLSFYSDDTFYLDPVMKEGIHGKKVCLNTLANSWQRILTGHGMQ